MKTLLLVAPIAFLLSSCSGGGTSEPPPVQPPTAAQLIAQGWQAFAARNYQDASAKFHSAIQRDATLPDAYNGAGWSEARLNHVDTALTWLAQGRQRDTNNVDLVAGLSVVQNARKQYLLSLDLGISALGKNPNWVFSRDTSVTSADVRMVLAEDYFALGDFASSLVIVRVYNPSFSPDVTTTEGQTALAVEIERLRNALH
jgi:tetratricopeptide (TPR) repeat protein